jgi:hypothetical protein
MRINNHEIPKKILEDLLEVEKAKVKTKLSYNLAKLLDSIIKCRKDFNIEGLLKKSSEELDEIKQGLEQPTLDRALLNNLSFTGEKKALPIEFIKALRVK